MTVKKLLGLFLAALTCTTSVAKTPNAAKSEQLWLRPESDTTAHAVWGFKEGIRIGIAPMGGPRGLIRVYAPYTGQKHPYKVVNFIALEPIPAGSEYRGLSELEWSRLDQVPGKRFWSGNTAEPGRCKGLRTPASGVVTTEKGHSKLSVYIFCERFDNGADVFVRITFTQGRPYEFELETFRTELSVPLRNFIVTATMGNYARLRTLYLADGKQKTAGDIWPEYRGDGFTPHDLNPISQLIRDKDNGVWFIAAPNETSPEKVVYAPTTSPGWHYSGQVATQYWYCAKPDAALQGAVNGRYCYWASQSPLPGGIAYENFELIQPYAPGQVYVFGITPQTPQQLIRSIKKQRR